MIEIISTNNDAYLATKLNNLIKEGYTPLYDTFKIIKYNDGLELIYEWLGFELVEKKK